MYDLMKAVSVRACTFVFLFTGLIGSALSADLPNPALVFGKQTVGSLLADVKQYKKGENCVLEKDNIDCTFIDQNGVKYLVFDKAVIAVVAKYENASSKIGLPYGLKFGDGLDVTIRKLVSLGDDQWLVGTDHEGGIAVSSYKQYLGKNGVKFNVELRFIKEKLTEVTFRSGTI